MINRRAGRFLVGLTLTALAMSPVLAGGVDAADEGGRVCRAGMIVMQMESCTYPGTSDEFTVGSDGKGRFLSFTASGLLNARNVTVDGSTYNFAARSQGGGRWRILVAGQSPAAVGPGGPPPSPMPTHTPAPSPTPETDEGVCQAGLIVRAGEGCTYPGTPEEFTVGSDRKGRFLSFRAGGLLNARNVTVGSRWYIFAARSQGGGRWRILVAGDPAVTGLCANGIAVPDPHKNRGLLGDCNVLLESGDALAGDATLNWSADLPVTEWEGVAAGGSPARVRRVVLGSRGLTGDIPAQLGGLTRLEVLDLHDNELSGPISPDLGSLATLDWLSLYGNQLSGSIPPELGNLINLEGLQLNDNRLTGPIPPGLGDLANLKWLLLYDNQLGGRIPPELGNLANLEGLYLGGNQLSGPIPPELGSLSNLVDLWIHGNRLSGSIPPELGSLSNLYWLVLYDNQLSGPIPLELSNLRQSGLLHLKGNQLTGCIPRQLANRPGLQITHDGLPECVVTPPTTPSDPTGLPRRAPWS